MKGHPDKNPTFCAVKVEVDTDALVVRLDDFQAFVLVGKSLEFCQHILTVGGEIFQIDLDSYISLILGFSQCSNQVGDVFVLFLEERQFDQYLGDDISTVVQEVVLLEGAVAGGLDGQGAQGALVVQTDGFIDDVLVSSLEAVVFAAQGIDEYGEAVGSDGIGDNGCSGMFIQCDGAHQGNQIVAVDRFAAGIDDRSTIHIGVEDDAKIGFRFEGGADDGLDGFLVFRIRYMVGEIAIRIEELTARSVCTKDLQYLLGEEPACAVSGIHNDFHAFERSVAAGAFLDNIDDVAGVSSHKVKSLKGVKVFDVCGGIVDACNECFDVPFVQTAVFCEELHAVPVERQVACRNHDTGVAVDIFELGAHEG